MICNGSLSKYRFQLLLYSSLFITITDHRESRLLLFERSLLSPLLRALLR